MRTTYERRGDWVPVGDPADGVGMPQEVSARLENDAGPVVEVTVRVEDDGRPYVARVVLETGSDGAPVTAADLARVAVDEVANRLIAGHVMDLQPVPDREPVLYLPPPGQMEQVIESRRRRRTSVTPQRLRQVATVYGEGGIDAVIDRLHVSQSQAYRLAAKARQAGLIQPKED